MNVIGSGGRTIRNTNGAASGVIPNLKNVIFNAERAVNRNASVL
ncbi:hypothetical protein [Salipaludibacillus agaradhaerens]|nr:hypothetical protein [Salipaludibacillus agaradhaerens]